MASKEKAEELFTNYRYILSIPNAPLGELKDDIAKSCALITVDEIINSVVVTNLSVAENQFIYWEQVKQEIRKL